MDRDFKGINSVNQDDPVVLSTIIVNFMVSRVLIDPEQHSSRDLRSHPILSTPTQVHSLALQAKELRPEDTRT